MKTPIAFAVAISLPLALCVSVGVRRDSICSTDSCSAIHKISRTCGYDVKTDGELISHYSLDCICNSRGFPDAIATCAPCITEVETQTKDYDFHAEWRQICSTDLSWYDESSLSPSSSSADGARILKLADGKS